MCESPGGTYHTWGGWFAIAAPSGWSQEQDDEVILFYDNDGGVGALQVSLASRNLEKPVSYADAEGLAQSFAASRSWTAVVFEEIEISGSPGCRFTYVEPDGEPMFWEVWHIVDDTRAATITYLCDVEQEPVERSIRQEIVSSFRWLPRETGTST
jgi:hypothetical protein